MKNQNLLFPFVLTCAFLILLTNNIQSQAETTPFRTYATQIYNNNLLSTDSQFRDNLNSLEDTINNFSLYDSIVPKLIPVVFHILQSPGMRFFSDTIIVNQLDQLNYDFNNATPHGIVLDTSLEQYVPLEFIPQINFCFTDTIGGIPIDQFIIRTDVTTPSFQVSNEMKSRDSDGSDPILPENCLNIWVCNLPDSIAGFSQMPGGPVATDGIVISYKYLIPDSSMLHTADYNKGKTLTHLVGSYLGVYELWNETNPCYDDYVYDTPIHNAPNHGFEIPYVHTSTCPGHPVEMIINHMDNYVDSMELMFTKGQVYRMHGVLNSLAYRGALCNNPFKCSDSLYRNNIIIPDPIVRANKFNVYPNPANSTIHLDIENQTHTPILFYLYDISGRLCLQEKWNDSITNYSKIIDVSGIHPGIYYICLNTLNDFKTFPITIIN